MSENMEEMPKDRELEQEFREYFDGADAPQCDLSNAKRALAVPRRAEKSRKRRGWIGALVSACASAAVILVLCLTLIPSALVSSRTYSLADTAQRSVSAAEIKEEYAEETKPLLRFEEARNASCEYSLVERKDETVLVRADVAFYSVAMRFDATVYIDVSGGKYTVKDFEKYETLQHTSRGVRYETETDGETGSYLSLLCVEGGRGEASYYISMLSDQPQSLHFLLQYLQKNI